MEANKAALRAELERLESKRDGHEQEQPPPGSNSRWATTADLRARIDARGARALPFVTLTYAQVKKTPSWPRSWANFSLL
jgi:hypothetical protein